jgi:hypothetical protein
MGDQHPRHPPRSRAKRCNILGVVPAKVETHNHLRLRLVVIRATSRNCGVWVPASRGRQGDGFEVPSSLEASRFLQAELAELESPYGLAASVWTRNLGTAHKMARRLQAGSIGVNMHGTLDPAMPFGGYKQSGWGREKGREVLDLYTEVKAVVMAL